MLFAVHISDGIVAWPWLVGGWIGTIGLLLLGMAAVSAQVARGDDSVIPRLGVLTAAFFVASQLHLPLGGVSVHLLLNGVVGLVLGIRSPIAIAIGLTFQALFFAHGGLTTLGLNTCVVGVPALLAGAILPRVINTNRLKNPVVRFALVSLLAIAGLSLGVLAAQSLWLKVRTVESEFFLHPESLWIVDPIAIIGILATAMLLAALERRIERDPLFPLGVLLGGSVAGLTVALNCSVLTLGGIDQAKSLGALVAIAHLPVILVEAVGCGFILVFLARVKPEWIGGYSPTATGTTSSNETSH